jgi:AraC-like DNA-binding protein
MQPSLVTFTDSTTHELSLDPIAVAAIVYAVDRRLGPARATVTPPTGTQLGALARYWIAATRAAGESLALDIAADVPVGAFGMMGVGVASAATLADALDTLARDYIGRVAPGMGLEVVRVDRDEAEIRISAGDTSGGALLEEIVIAMIHRNLALLAEPVAVRGVELRRAAPASAARWSEFFAAPVSFARATTALRLPAAALRTALRTASPEVQAMVERERGAQSMASRVKAHVRANPDGNCDAAAIATALGTSTRTLQRRLHGEDTSLRELVTATRLEVAREMLAHSDTAVSAIALAVGFAHPAGFSRAFSAACGVSPIAYRARVQAA